MFKHMTIVCMKCFEICMKHMKSDNYKGKNDNLDHTYSDIDIASRNLMH